MKKDLPRKRYPRASAFVSLIFVSALMASSAMAENLIVNGGFESGATRWWGGAVKAEAIAEGGAPEGSRSLRIAGGFACQDRITVESLKHYRLSMKIRAENAPEESIYVQMSFRGPGVSSGWYGPLNRKSERVVFVTGGTHAWREFSTVIQAPEDAMQVLIYLRKISRDEGAAWFDDVSLEPVASPEPAATKAPTDAEKAPEVVGNLVRNGGFEEGPAGWIGGAFQHGGGASAENAMEGAQNLKIIGHGVVQERIPVRGGRNYKISVWVRTESAPLDSVFVQTRFDGPENRQTFVGPLDRVVMGDKQRMLFSVGGTRPWREYSTVVTAPSGARALALFLRKNPDSEGTAYFDRVSVEATDEPATTAIQIRGRVLADEILPVASANAAASLAKVAAMKPADGDGKVRLAADGRALAAVHVGSSEDLRALAAAQDLTALLGQITGADFGPLSHDDHPRELPLIVVGRDNALTAKLCPDIAYDEFGEDGFVIRTVGPHVVIAGNTPGGTMYGVNWFLDRVLGVKWLSPDYTHIPSRKTLEIARLDETQRPRFTFRQVLSSEGHDRRFVSRNLMNGNSHGFGHTYSPPEINHWDSSWQAIGLTGSFHQLMPPDQWKGTHPQWFAGGQVAMMDPEVRWFMSRAIIRKLRSHANYQDYWFGFMDNDWSWDMDARSREFAARHGNAPSAPRLDMTIDVHNRVKTELPGARIAFNAYHWSFTPPAGMTVPDDLLVYPMTIHVDYSTPLNKGRNEQMGRDIAGWNDIAKTILLWDHITNFHGYIQPTPNIYPIAESIRWLAGLENIFGYFAEGSWNTRGAEFASLRVWLIARMLWDPQTDIRAAVAEYCDAYFGPASKPIKDYIDLMHAEAARTQAAIWEKTNVDSPLLNFDFIAKADRLMEQAEAAVANDPVMLRHVRQVRVCVDYVVLLRRHEYQIEAKKRGVAWSADTARRRARFDDTVSKEQIRQYRQGGTMEALASIMDIERTTPAPPAMVKDLRASDWIEIQDLGINRYYKPTIIVADPQASDGGAARLDGNSEGWVIQVKQHLVPEEGQWEIYAEVRVDAEGVTDGNNVLAVGSAPPMSRFTQIPYRQVKGYGYHVVKVPGGPFRYNGDDQAIAYIRGVKSDKVKHIYVDRFFMVRVK